MSVEKQNIHLMHAIGHNRRSIVSTFSVFDNVYKTIYFYDPKILCHKGLVRKRRYIFYTTLYVIDISFKGMR